MRKTCKNDFINDNLLTGIKVNILFVNIHSMSLILFGRSFGLDTESCSNLKSLALNICRVLCLCS
jgi:hypothetical protein